MRFAFNTLVVGALSVFASCGGSSSKSDAGPKDLLSVFDAGRDASRDVEVDSRADVGGDLYATGACGGQRTLTPTLIAPGPSTPCGPGCKRITWGSRVGRFYAVSGDLLTYVNPIGSDGGFRVYYVDLASGKEYQLHEDWPNLTEGCNVVDTDGERIAMSCVRDGLTPVSKPQWLRSLTTYDPKTRVATDHHCIERRRADKSCFPFFVVANANGVSIDIPLAACPKNAAYHLPFGASSLTNVVGAVEHMGHLRGEGNKLVWMQYKAEWKTYQIVHHDLLTKTSTRVSPWLAPQWLPQISGDKIVWADHRNDPSGTRLDPKNVDIYLHDLKTGKTTAVTTHPARQAEPDVWGDWVVWHDYRDNANGVSGKELDVWAKNMATGTEYQVTDYPGIEAYARVDSGRIFYQRVDPIDGQLAVFMVDIKTWLAAKSKSGSN